MAVDFTEKLGPLPVWAWGLIGGGVVTVGAFLFQRKGSEGSSDSAGGSSSLDASGYQTAGIKGGTADTSNAQTYDNNALWLQRASRNVAGSLGKSASDVYATLQKFLSGQSLSTADKAVVDTALGQYGTPPEGTQGTSVFENTPTVNAKSKGYYIVDPGGGKQRGIFELYDNGTNRWISGDEWGVILGRGQTVSGTITKNEFDMQYGKDHV